MTLLADTFRARDSRVTKTIVVIDLTNSTGMKEEQPEANWLTTYGWFFDLLLSTISDKGGRIVKYMGDGAMAVFDEDSPADAINWGIEVQENIAEAQQRKVISCDCSVGIAYGDVVEFDTRDGQKDYIGSIVDKAFRLCSAANSKALFVDTDTCAAAPMNRVKSRMGVAAMPRRTVADYQGQVESVKVKGFSSPVDYYEILWGPSRFGVSPPFVTEASRQFPVVSTRLPSDGATAKGQPVQPLIRESPPPPPTGWLRGVVLTINDRFGFIRSSAGEDFWFNSNYLFRRSLAPKVGDAVWFLASNALTGAKNRRAMNILPLGVTVDGKLERVNQQKGYGFVLCQDERGETKQFFIHLGDTTSLSSGMRINFKISENSKGISGVEPRTAASADVGSAAPQSV